MNSVIRPAEKIMGQNFVAGQWAKGSGESIPVVSPYFGEIVGEVNGSTVEDVDGAIQKAATAQKDWQFTPIKERTQIMFKFREILYRDMDKICQCISLENGKTLGESRAGVMKGIEVLEFAISLQNSDTGGRTEVSRGVYCEYRRRPVGVVANITPFNFPAMVPMWTIPNVLTLGNAYVWKPSEKTPLTATHIASALSEAGLPNGLFTILHGKAKTVEAIIDHPLVKAISFVGSSAVAKKVYQRGTNLGKRVLALGGAKNHIVLLPDAEPTITGKGISDSFTGCAGQRCMAASVVLAVGDVDSLIESVVAQAKSARLGHSMGAIISKEQLKFLHDAIDQAAKEGAKVVLDGRNSKSSNEYANGFWLGPTVLDNVNPGSDAATKELFGPILAIIRCKNLSEAMEIQKSNEYGNACSVFTTSGALAERVLSEAQAGMLGVNIGVPVPREPFSFGGIHDSKFGYGDITGPASLNLWSDLIKVTTKWEKQEDATWMS